MRAALKALGIDQLVLIVFDAALPQAAEWDIGVGTPYSAHARRFFEFVHSLGFTGVQFGPQGAVSRDFASPYDGTAFSRNPLSIAPDELSCSEALALAAAQLDGGLLPVSRVAKTLESAPYDDPTRTTHATAFDLQDCLLSQLTTRLRRFAASPTGAPLLDEFCNWRLQNREWLLSDGLYELLCARHGVGDFTEFPRSGPSRLDSELWRTDLRAAGPNPNQPVSLLGYPLETQRAARLLHLATQAAGPLEDYAWRQFVAAQQHSSLRRWARERGLELYGDLHIGYSRRDFWHFESLFLPGYLVGAPPSRTNPEGQPWGYPTLAPELFVCDGEPGPALRLLALRAERLFSDYDRLRVDHPHGLVCPWVYRADDPDPLHAVQSGARLFSSPDLPDHPRLAGLSIVDSSQLDRQLRRHADGWVRTLSAEQVRRFATCFDVLARQARASGGTDRLVCEVLSTQPTELREVLGLYGLGRFRVTQKAKLDDPADVYSTANAQPEDWMLMGNHDTPTIWGIIERWKAAGTHLAQARHLAARLSRDERHRQVLLERLSKDPGALAHAKLAELFTGRARNVMISFCDLFGMREPYNVPGTIRPENWSQRIPRQFTETYARRVERNRALSLQRALLMALEARGQTSLTP